MVTLRLKCNGDGYFQLWAKDSMVVCDSDDDVVEMQCLLRKREKDSGMLRGLPAFHSNHIPLFRCAEPPP